VDLRPRRGRETDHEERNGRVADSSGPVQSVSLGMTGFRAEAQTRPSTVRIVLTTPFALFVGATQLARSLSSGWAFAIANE
jgi:hypothetical protein